VYQDVPEHVASHPHGLNINAMCCDKNQQKCAGSPGSFKRIGNYATNVHYHHIRIPLNMSKVIDTPT
jgi:hypothetical protein